MSAWTQTPFLTIGEAHQVAEVMGMTPSAIRSQGGGEAALKTFSVLKGKVTLLVAQRASGAPAPVMQKEVGQKLVLRIQDPNALRFHEHKRLAAGPWVLTQHISLIGAVEHRRRNVTNFEPPVRSGTLVVFAEPKGEYIEYLYTGEGVVLARSLRPMYSHPKEEI